MHDPFFILALSALCALPTSGRSSKHADADWLPRIRVTGWSAVHRDTLRSDPARTLRVQPLDVGFSVALEWSIGGDGGAPEAIRDGRPPDGPDPWPEQVPADGALARERVTAEKDDDDAIAGLPGRGAPDVSPEPDDTQPRHAGVASEGDLRLRIASVRREAAALRRAATPGDRRRATLARQEARALLRLAEPSSRCAAATP